MSRVSLPKMDEFLPLTGRLMLALNYRFTVRSSDFAAREYTQNLVCFGLTFRFQ